MIPDNKNAWASQSQHINKLTSAMDDPDFYTLDIRLTSVVHKEIP